MGCRNTLFNAVPQTAAEYLPRLTRTGRGTCGSSSSTTTRPPCPGQSASTRTPWQGRRDARTLWRDLKASSQYGVTRGPLNVL